MRYKALPKDVAIDPEVALLQSALALDAAAETAERMNDADGLLNTAAMWMKFSEAIQSFTDAAERASREGEVVKNNSSKIEVGFQASRPEENSITTEGEEDG